MAKGSPSKAKAATKMKAPKKEKKVKDPNAPKRPKSAYFFFMDDIRASIKKDNPDASIGELGKLMGEEWSKLKEKNGEKKYTEKAAADKVRYEKEMAKYKK